MNTPLRAFCTLLAFTAVATDLGYTLANDFGLFTDHADIGSVGQAGSAEHVDGVYRVTGSGENMWFSEDAFHYIYRQVQGDISLSADIEWVGAGNHEHRKACLLIRQSLDPDSAYADAALHGDGLTSLQCRAVRGANTHEIQANVSGPTRLRIVRRGSYVSIDLARQGDELKPAGGNMRLELSGPYYVGLGICSHDNDHAETARFTNVSLEVLEPPRDDESFLHSTLETINIASTDRRVVYHSDSHFEAPNWSRDGKTLVFNSDGKIYEIPVAGGEPRLINTGAAERCNNDHGLSPDGKWLVISDQSNDEWLSRIYALPSTGLPPGEQPRLVTPNAPSYWHGWSPDGETLAYCAERDGEYDIYSIPFKGGDETRLTDADGLDDGPDYSHDGRHLYFNSNRTGKMHLWRIDAGGGNPKQLTHDDRNNWFPHPSPDGKWIAYLSYEPHVEGHPPNQDVELRLLSTSGGKPRTIATLFGGQGTINVPSWSPDSQDIAFVSYQVRHQAREATEN